MAQDETPKLVNTIGAEIMNLRRSMFGCSCKTSQQSTSLLFLRLKTIIPPIIFVIVLVGCALQIKTYEAQVPKFEDDRLFFELYENSVVKYPKNENVTKSKMKSIFAEIQKRGLDKDNIGKIIRIQGLARILILYENISVKELINTVGKPDKIRKIDDYEHHMIYVDNYTFKELNDYGKYVSTTKRIYSLFCVRYGKIYKTENNYNMTITHTGTKPTCSL